MSARYACTCGLQRKRRFSRPRVTACYRGFVENRGTAVRIGFCCIVAGAGAASSVAACGEGPGIEQYSYTEVSRTICEKILECGCSPFLSAAGVAPPLSCEGWSLIELSPPSDDDGAEYGGEYGDFGDDDDDSAGGDVTITFDQACVDLFADRLSIAACDAALPPLACDELCKIRYGTRFAGQPCVDDDQCAQGLVCVFEECRDPCTVQTVGEGESCEFAVCAAGLVCSDDGAPTCVATAGGGDFCGEQRCDPTSWCDFGDPVEPRCRSRGSVGAPCTGHSQCTTGNCPAGFCADLPGEGEPCSGGRCREGVTCVRSEATPDGVCFFVSPACAGIVANFQ